MSGWSSSTRGNALIACTSWAPAANDLVRKYAFAPSPSTRQSSTPSDSRNCFGLMLSVMRASLSPDHCCEALARLHPAMTSCLDLQYVGPRVRHRAHDRPDPDRARGAAE